MERKPQGNLPRGWFGKNNTFQEGNAIAILGGMGPQASARLLETLINTLVGEGFRQDFFPQILLNSIPVPNFMENTHKSQQAELMLQQNIKSLEAFKPACFTMVCNTAHILLHNLQAHTEVPFISLIESVAQHVRDSKIKTVGLLASPTTIRCGLYQNILEKEGIEVILPSVNHQKTITKIITRVLEGKIENKNKKDLAKIAVSLKKRGAQGIVLGCTELPLVYENVKPLIVFDSIQILANTLVDFYKSKGGEIYGKRK